jgi:hypothetical protein
MPWTQPKTWTSEPLTSSDLNMHLRDNLEMLKAPPTASYTLNQATDYTTTSTTFTNVDATNLSLTIVTSGGDVMVHFDCFCANATGAVYLDFTVDGARHAGDEGVARTLSNSGQSLAFTRLVRGLTAGSHTFNLQWRVSGGTGTLYAGAGTVNFDIHPQFWVREAS